MSTQTYSGQRLPRDLHRRAATALVGYWGGLWLVQARVPIWLTWQDKGWNLGVVDQSIGCFIQVSRIAVLLALTNVASPSLLNYSDELCTGRCR